MSSVAPTRLSRIVPLDTSRSLNCTFARRLPGVLWSALVTTYNFPSIITAWPRRMSLARMSLLGPFVYRLEFRHLRLPGPLSPLHVNTFCARERVAKYTRGAIGRQTDLPRLGA